MTETKSPRTPSVARWRFERFALVVAAAGAAIGFSATAIAWAQGAPFPKECFYGSLFALTAAIPVLKSHLRNSQQV